MGRGPLALDSQGKQMSAPLSLPRRGGCQVGEGIQDWGAHTQQSVPWAAHGALTASDQGLSQGRPLCNLGASPYQGAVVS